MTAADWPAVLAAVTTTLGGDRDAGRRDLLQCWDSLEESGYAAQRCVLAHYLADLEPVLDDEVRWDERALAAYAEVGPGDLEPLGITDAAAFAPSLHLNLGDGYRRQGRMPAAREQVAAGLAAASALADDGYGAMVRAGLHRLATRLDGGPEEPAP